MGEKRGFILDALVAEGSVEAFAVFHIPLEPGARKIRKAEAALADLGGLALAGKALVSGRAVTHLTYVDESDEVRFVSHREAVSGLIPLAGVEPGMDILPAGEVGEQVVELPQPDEAVVKAGIRFRALATQRVVVNDIRPGEVAVVRRGFVEAREEHVTRDDFDPSIARDVSERTTYTFFVRNTGLVNSAQVQLEISPDGFLWQPDGALIRLAPLDNAVITPLHFLRFARLRFRSAVAGLPARLTIWFQAQA